MNDMNKCIIAGRPAVMLSNGLVVVNHSSPHSFTFEDGSVLDGCDASLSHHLCMSNHDEERLFTNRFGRVHTKVTKKFNITVELVADLEELMENYRKGMFDICLVALPLLLALKEEFSDAMDAPFFEFIRCIYVEDRVNKLISISKFTF